MTAPYRLRDAFGDRKSAMCFLSVLGPALCLGITPEIVAELSLGSGAMLVWIAIWTNVMLVNMHTTDRRLREVSSA